MCRRLQQTQAQESHFHSVGDPFSDSCLDHLNADTQGRLLPAVCPKYTLVPRHASPGQHGCVAQSVAEAVVDDQGKQVRTTRAKQSPRRGHWRRRRDRPRGRPSPDVMMGWRRLHGAHRWWW